MATHDFLITFDSNHGPILYRFRDKWQFQSKIAKFPHPRVFNAPLRRFPLGNGAWARKSNGATMPRKKNDDIFSHLDTIHERHGQTDRQTDRWTDRQTPTDSKYCSYT